MAYVGLHHAVLCVMRCGIRHGQLLSDSLDAVKVESGAVVRPPRRLVSSAEQCHGAERTFTAQSMNLV